METPAIESIGLTRDYGELRAVDHVSFAVRPGEVFGFLGPNGAGKTTTVRMLTTLLAPTSGKGLLNGYDIVRQGYQARRQFGVVPEESNVYRELSGRANLLFSGRLYRVPGKERDDRATALLGRFELLERQRDLADTYSRGMRRKLTIAMALMHQPPILFLDEPTAGLDVHGQRSIRECIRELSAEGVTIFLTTHQLEEADELCDRIAIINRGKIAAVGTPERLKLAFKRLHSIEVAFDPSPEGIREELGKLAGVENAIKAGDKFRLYTAEPPALLTGIMVFAAERGLRVMTVSTLTPTLEDVFLLITGRVPSEGEQAGRRGCPRGDHGGANCRGDGSCRGGGHR